MVINKKQKKQLDIARKKLMSLQQLLAAAKKQPDDPREPARLEREIAEVEQQIAKIQGQ